jgi:(p)ppGpp synthase/HD superfamily hydrolase
MKQLPNPQLSPRFSEAVAYACEAHRDQPRKRTEIPYVAHLLAVTAIVLEHGATEDEAIAAILHDVVEDQGGPPRLANVRAKFGDAIADIVAACTDADVTPKPPWRERKEAHIRHLAKASSSVRLVVAADKLHNARSLLSDYRQHGEALWDRFKGKREGTLWYLREMVKALRSEHHAALIDELDRAVTALDQAATSQPTSKS